MTVPVEAVPPVAQTGHTEDLHMVKPTDNEVDMFQQGFAHMEIGTQESTIHMAQKIGQDQMGIVTQNIQAAKGLLTEED